MNIFQIFLVWLLYLFGGSVTIAVVYNRWNLYYKTPLWEGLIFVFWPLVLLYALTIGLLIEWVHSVWWWYECDRRRRR